MQVAFYDEAHKNHVPKMWFYRGVAQQSRELPDRAYMIRDVLANADYELRQPEDFGRAPLERVHTKRYIDFLEVAYSDWIALEGTGPEVVANMFPIGKEPGYPEIIQGRAGFHMEDLSCPINEGTWRAAYGSAQTALATAKAVLQAGGSASAYGLCRPPGHHAFAERAAGYCYLNNAGIAAQYLRDHGAERVSILDIDVHHGNGTQDIFYDRGDVQFVSIHGDPSNFSPFFWGYADQIGRGVGEGANINFPLPLGADEAVYLDTVDKAVKTIEDYSPDAVVISLGLDTFIGDPYAAFGVTTEGFQRIAEKIRRVEKPTVILQEGGYLCPQLGENAASFLSAYR